MTRIIKMECLAGMSIFIEDNSVDAIVTDPPYGLKFMGKKWDYEVPSVAIWEECLRVLKPGGYLLSFAGSRTYHRMAVNIEDAGFEIRDQIMWVYGSGFPKSLDISKAIDAAAGAAREIVGKKGGRSASPKQDFRGGAHHAGADTAKTAMFNDITAPATDEAAQWSGWGTALKPAHEPIVMARKPFKSTVAANVLAHGTGGINIDGCRIGTDEELTGGAGVLWSHQRDNLVRPSVKRTDNDVYGKGLGAGVQTEPSGRWPANLAHDGSDEVLALFPHSKSGAMKKGTQRAAQDEAGSVCYGVFGGGITSEERLASEGSAARFFYCPKISKADRDEGMTGERVSAADMVGRKEGSAGMGNARAGAGRTSGAMNNHPTVKPTALMQWLVRMVTPAGGTVLDPFTGSGSTGKAAVREGFEFIGFEMEAESVAIARQRVAYEVAAAKASAKPDWMKDL